MYESGKEKAVTKTMNFYITILVFALVVGFSWSILFQLVIHTYSKNENCELRVEPKNGTIVMKSENDTINYYERQDGDCWCEKLRCVRRCCLTNEVYNGSKCIPGKEETPLSLFFPYYITENVTLSNVCPHYMESLELDYVNFSVGKRGNLFEKNYEVEHNHYCIIDDTSIIVCNEKDSNDYAVVGK